MKLRYASVLALSIAASAHAETFRVELNAGFGQGDAENIDYDAVALGGTVYFSDVNTGSDPLREAAFLDKASGLSVTEPTCRSMALSIALSRQLTVDLF